MSNQKRRRLALTVIVVSAAVLATLWFLRREKPLVFHSRRELNAWLDCDGGTLASYAFPEEIEANGLNASKASEVCREIVRPSISRFRISQGPYDEVLTSEAVTRIELRNSSGLSYDFACEAWPMDGGAKSGFTRRIVTAWCIDYCLGNNVPFSAEAKAEAIKAGYARDKPLLDRLGITKYCYEDIYQGQVFCVPWQK